MLKGMLPFKGVLSLVLGVMFLLVGYQVITGINAESLEPNANALEQALSSYGTQEVTLGDRSKIEGVSEAEEDPQYSDDAALEAEKQFRGLVVFNMLSAANCRLPKILGIQLQGRWDDTNIDEDVRNNYDEIVKARFFHGFDELRKQTEYQTTCFGAKTIDMSPVNDVKNFLNPLRAGSVEPGNDMEGKFGRVFFDVDSTFIINDGDYHEDVIQGWGPPGASGTHSDPPGENDGHGEKLLLADFRPLIKHPSHPDFWRGDRISAFTPVPDGVKSADWSDAKYHELYNDEEFQGMGFYSINLIDGMGEKGREEFTTQDFQEDWEKLYSYRVRMKNVPTVIEAGFDPDQFDISEFNKGEEDRFERFVEEAQYVFCRGAEGEVQSNSKNIDQGSEDPTDLSYWENAVFPRISLNPETRKDCIVDPGENGYSRFAGYEVDGKTCSLEEAIGSIETKNVNIDGEGEVEAACGLEQDTTDFEFGGSTYNYEYERPGLFVQSDVSVSYSEDRMPSAEYDGFNEDQEFMQDGESWILKDSPLNLEGTFLRWEDADQWEKFRLRFSPMTDDIDVGRLDISLDPGQGGSLDNYVEWDEGESSYSIGGESSTVTGTEPSEITWEIVLDNQENKLTIDPSGVNEKIEKEVDYINGMEIFLSNPDNAQAGKSKIRITEASGIGR